MSVRTFIRVGLLLLLVPLALWFQETWTRSADRARGTVSPADPDTLALEVGGDHPRLVVPAPPSLGRRPRSQERPAPPPPRPRPRERPARTVKLQDGDTIYGICVRELGDGSRMAEVLQLNGLSEQDAVSLRPGTEIRLPR